MDAPVGSLRVQADGMQLNGRSILVTGGAGFIGSHLVDALHPHRVRVLDDFSTGQRRNLAHHADQGRVELVEGDIRDNGLIRQLLRGVSVVFHLACRGVRHSIGYPQENHEVNAAGTLNLLQAARDARVERFVHVSSSEVYGTARYVPMDEGHPCFPETVYGAAKLAGEAYARAYCQTYRLPTVIVRPFNNFGPRSHFEGDSGEVIPRFAVWALNGRQPVIFGDGTQTRDFIYVADTVYWLCRIAECDQLVGQTVNLGSGKETSVNELASAVGQAAGLGYLAPRYLPPRPGDVQRHLAGVEHAKTTLGFQRSDHCQRGHTPFARSFP
ncbi:MAG: NAD-dependent epimerase/dehydratase family protein [Planctomycetaceae bacterium]